MYFPSYSSSCWPGSRNLACFRPYSSSYWPGSRGTSLYFAFWSPTDPLRMVRVS